VGVRAGGRTRASVCERASVRACVRASVGVCVGERVGAWVWVWVGVSKTPIGEAWRGLAGVFESREGGHSGRDTSGCFWGFLSDCILPGIWAQKKPANPQERARAIGSAEFRGRGESKIKR